MGRSIVDIERQSSPICDIVEQDQNNEVNKVKKLLIIGLISIFFLTACGKTDIDNHAEHGEEHSGDLREQTASVHILPQFLADKSEEMRLVYQAAGIAADVLQWMPCYCGCGESVGHKSNKNCFIYEIKEDGSVVWDDHGTRCGVCLQIAAVTVQMKQEGKTNLEIRKFIDETYKEGYAKPTDTDMPAA